MATATKIIKGFKLTCPFCGDADATVRMDLNDLKACTCSGCDEEFSPQQARDKAAEMLKRWDAVCRWVDMAAEAMADGEM